MSDKVQHPKIDPYTIAVKQPYELDAAVKRLKKEGLHVTRDDIREAVKAVGHSRRKVYKYLREKNGTTGQNIA